MEETLAGSPLTGEGAFLPLPEAAQAAGREVDLIAAVLEIGAARRSRGTDHFATFKAVAPGCPPPGLSVTFFQRDPADLPRVARSGDIVCLRRVLVDSHEGEVHCTYRKRISSFALFRGDADDPVPYQTSRGFRGLPQDAPALKRLRSWAAADPRQLEDPYLLRLSLISEGKACDVVCSVLRVSGSPEAGWTLLVWDASDCQPLKFSSSDIGDLELFPARDSLPAFPRYGSVLEVRSVTPFKEIPHLQGGRLWCRLCNVVWESHRGVWRGALGPTSKIRILSEDDENAMDRRSFYAMRVEETGVMFRRPSDSLPEPAEITEIDGDIDLEDNLIASITNSAAHEFKCVVRVVAAQPMIYEDLWCSERGCYAVKLVLEDPTARIHALLDGEDGLKFFGGSPPDDDVKVCWNKLLGLRNPHPRNPPWVLCGLKACHAHGDDQVGSRGYRIIGTKLLK